MKGLLLSLLARADQGARLAVIGCMSVTVAVVSAQVAMRYVFNGSFDWADEVSRLSFVWTVFLAIPLGLRDGAHVGIDLLVARFPSHFREGLARVMAALAAIMLGVVTVTSIHVAAITWSERLGSLDVTSSVFFLPVIIGSAHAGLHLAAMALWPAAHAAAFPPAQDPETEVPS